MLKRISIHNYNCFVDFELEVPRTSLLVGSNGSGKTSLWNVLAGLQDVIVWGADVTSAFPTSTLTRWREDDPVQRFGLDVEVDDAVYRYELEIVHNVERRLASIRREHLESGGKVLYESADGEIHLHSDDASNETRTSFPFNRKRSFLPNMELRHDNRRTITFREALANLWLLAPAPRRLESTTSIDAHRLDRDGKNFASWFRGVLAERPHLITPILEDLKPAMPGLRTLGLKSVSAEVRQLMLTFEVAGTKYELSAGELSDGQRALLLLYGFLRGAIDRSATVFIDEPETGLAPHEMQPWISTLMEVIEDHRGQALIASHHPEIIDYVAAAHTIQFRRPHGGAAMTNEVTLETTGNRPVSEWLSRPWAYEDEDADEEGDDGPEEPAP